MAYSPQASISLRSLSGSFVPQYDTHSNNLLAHDGSELSLMPGNGLSARPASGNRHLKPSFLIEDTFRPVRAPSDKLVKWHIHWRSPFQMIFFAIAGVLLAGFHHVFYSILDKRIVASQTQQEWFTRIGSGLAFLCQSVMATAVAQAFTQHLWIDLKRKAIAIKTIDNMFAITRNLSAFLDGSLLHTKVLATLAAVTWLLPIMAVITPATLSVVPSNVPKTQTLNVPDVNWNATAFIDWSAQDDDFVPSFQAKRALTISAYSVATLSMVPAFPDYSYSVQFFGPSFRCQDVAGPGEEDLFNSIRPPDYNLTITDILNNNGTRYMISGTYMAELVFMGLSPFVGFNNAILLLTMERNISCTLWNTSFDITFEFSQGIQKIRENKVVTEEPYRQIPDHPILGFKVVAAAMASILTGHIETDYSGTPHFGAGGGDADLTNNTANWDPIYNTGLIVCPELGEHLFIVDPDTEPSTPNLTERMPRWMCRGGSLAKAVEDMSKNFTYSLFTLPDVITQLPVQAIINSLQNKYSYRPRNLLLTYGIGIFLTLIAIAIGGFGYYRNGYSASTSFSTILLTTRKNPSLDALSEGHCLGMEPLAEEVGRMKLKFGVLNQGESSSVDIGHAGFGLVGDTRSLKRGEDLS